MHRKDQRLSVIALGVLALLASVSRTSATTLRAAYELAGPREGYDKYVELETGVTYTGGLLIGPILSPITHQLDGEAGRDVRIAGHGAILDLQGSQLCVSYCRNRLDIDDCVILNGNIRFRGISTFDTLALPTGSVRYVTFYKPHDYGVRMQGSGDGILLERNLVVDAVNTGWDFIYTTGIPSDWLPTGTSFAGSVQIGLYGFPMMRENWTFHSNPLLNAQPLSHFSFL